MDDDIFNLAGEFEGWPVGVGDGLAAVLADAESVDAEAAGDVGFHFACGDFLSSDPVGKGPAVVLHRWSGVLGDADRSGEIIEGLGTFLGTRHRGLGNGEVTGATVIEGIDAVFLRGRVELRLQRDELVRHLGGEVGGFENGGDDVDEVEADTEDIHEVEGAGAFAVRGRCCPSSRRCRESGRLLQRWCLSHLGTVYSPRLANRPSAGRCRK